MRALLPFTTKPLIDRHKRDSSLDQLSYLGSDWRTLPNGFLMCIMVSISLFCSPLLLLADGPDGQQETTLEQEFSSLNIRMSNRAIVPPLDLIVKTIPLDGLSVARPFVEPSPQAAIIENDQRQRVALLSQNPEGIWQLYLLEPIPLDPMLPALFQCADARQCATDRMPMTGGLVCVAICVKELIEAVVLENH